jgi:hypothetical protein
MPIFGDLGLKIRRFLGLLKIYRIHRYVVRASGIVLPPKEFRKKTEYKPDTQIQFELSFEEEPYFRTLTEEYKVAQTRFESEITDLVRDQERHIERLPYLRSPFSWYIEVNASFVTKEVLDKFLENATDKDMENYKTKNIIKIPARPIFAVSAVDFEYVDVFEVTEDKVRELKSIDTFMFKVYRPNEEEEYWSRTGEFLHDL